MPGDPTEHRIAPAAPGQLNSIIGLLQNAGLTYQDCANQLAHFIVATQNDKVIACAASEPCGQFELLRSVAVEEAYRGQGIAHALFLHLKRRAQRNGTQTMYLLTENATAYFTRLGFHLIDRHMAPTEIQATRQFAGLCPQSALLMELALSGS